DGIAYLVGDDSPYLYCLDHDWNLLRKVPLFASEHTGDRIPKEQKPDLEAMSVVYLDDKPHLLIFGSGSRSPQRDVCFWVDLAAATLAPDSDQILFAAAVEDTTTELEDGPTLGSFLGFLSVEDGRTPRHDPTEPKQVALVRDDVGKVYTGKIESVAVLGRDGA